MGDSSPDPIPLVDEPGRVGVGLDEDSDFVAFSGSSAFHEVLCELVCLTWESRLPQRVVVATGPSKWSPGRAMLYQLAYHAMVDGGETERKSSLRG